MPHQTVERGIVLGCGRRVTRDVTRPPGRIHLCLQSRQVARIASDARNQQSLACRDQNSLWVRAVVKLAPARYHQRTKHDDTRLFVPGLGMPGRIAWRRSGPRQRRGEHRADQKERGEQWRERVGIEPTPDTRGARQKDLKSSGTTRSHSLPHRAQPLPSPANRTADSSRTTTSPAETCQTRRLRSAASKATARRGAIATSRPPEVCGS